MIKIIIRLYIHTGKLLFYPRYGLTVNYEKENGILELPLMMMIAPNSSARKGGKKKGEVKREYMEAVEESLRGQQSATCCTMCKKGSVGDWAREV